MIRHRVTDSSADELIAKPASAEIAIETIGALTGTVRRHIPVSAYQKRSVLSSLAEMTRRPSAYVGLKICAAEPSLPHNIIVVCKKVSRGQDADNSIFLDGRADYRSRSPFLTDKKCLNLAEKYD